MLENILDDKIDDVGKAAYKRGLTTEPIGRLFNIISLALLKDGVELGHKCYVVTRIVPSDRKELFVNMKVSKALVNKLRHILTGVLTSQLSKFKDMLFSYVRWCDPAANDSKKALIVITAL